MTVPEKKKPVAGAASILAPQTPEWPIRTRPVSALKVKMPVRSPRSGVRDPGAGPVRHLSQRGVALFGLAAGGRLGVARALDLLRHEFDTTLALLGCRGPAELGAGLIASR